MTQPPFDIRLYLAQQHNALPFSQVAGPGSSQLFFYVWGSRTLVVQTWPDGSWDAYCGTNTNSVDATVAWLEGILA